MGEGSTVTVTQQSDEVSHIESGLWVMGEGSTVTVTQQTAEVSHIESEPTSEGVSG